MSRGYISGVVVGTVIGKPFIGRPKIAGGPPAFASIGVSITRHYFGKAHSAWMNCVFPGKAGEVIAKYADKGTRIFATGRLEQRRWTDKEGCKRLDYKMIVEEFQFLDRLGFKPEATEAATVASLPSHGRDAEKQRARYKGAFR